MNRMRTSRRLGPLALALAAVGAALPGVVRAQEVLPRESIADFLQDPAKLAALTRAVKVMQDRPEGDPTSWWYQAKIHGAGDPVTNQPDNSDPHWNQCQHQHWWFPAWHRAYVYCFERLLQKAAGDPKLRLPYWDYTDPTQRALPAPFLDPNSPLYVPGRRLRSGDDELRPTEVDTGAAFSRLQFLGSDLQGGFGGGRVDVPVQFPDQDQTGSLEKVPHNAVHRAIGGKMGHPYTAALDPIFWLHHCNIDRLWEAWASANPGWVNELDDTFKNYQFTLIDETGKPVRHTVGELLDTTKLGYAYGRLGDRQAPAVLAALLRRPAEPPRRGPLKSQALAEAAPPEAVTVKGDPVTVTLKPAPAADLRALAPGAPAPPDTRFALVLSGVEFARLPTSNYEVYLNLPTADHTTAGQTRHYVGLLAIFEAPHGKGHADHGKGKKPGRTYAFDVTRTLEALHSEKGFDPKKLTVTVVPVGPIRQGRPTRPQDPVELRIRDFTLQALHSAPLAAPAGVPPEVDRLRRDVQELRDRVRRLEAEVERLKKK
jgi:tyrosinase